MEKLIFMRKVKDITAVYFENILGLFNQNFTKCNQCKCYVYKPIELIDAKEDRYMKQSTISFIEEDIYNERRD
jgi:hypothetical protein